MTTLRLHVHHIPLHIPDNRQRGRDVYYNDTERNGEYVRLMWITCFLIHEIASNLFNYHRNCEASCQWARELSHKIYSDGKRNRRLMR